MNWKNTISMAMMLAFSTSQLAWSNSGSSQSKRIEVYSLTQNYWDTKNGETLGEIVQQLLPYNNHMQQRLMQDIVELNPNAFMNNDPDYMRANTRLWLPNNMTKADSRVDHTLFSVQSFSWGNIKRPKR